MVQRAVKFTPQALLSAPRRSAGVPNVSGTKVLYTTSSYSFETHKKTSELRVLDVSSGESFELASNDAIDHINWLNEDEFICLQSEDDSTTSVYWASVSKCLKKVELGNSHYVAGTIDGPAADLKVRSLGGADYAIVVSAQASPDGTLYNPNKAKKTHATGKLYNGLFTRHWDRWETKVKNSLWFAKLSRKGGKNGKFQISTLVNALQGTGLESPIRPFGGSDNFDLSHDRIVFVAKDPERNPALNTRVNLYIVNVPSWEASKRAEVTEVHVPGYEGACTSPVFSPDGRGIAFLKMATNGYEADRNALFFIRDLSTDSYPSLQSPKAALWDRSPSSVTFSLDGKKLLVTAEEIGRSKVFEIDPWNDAISGRQPRALTQHGAINEARPLSGGRIFVSGSSIVDSSFFAIVDATSPPSEVVPSMTWINSNSSHGNKFGLKSSQVSSIWTPASNPTINKEVHSFVIKPSHFDPSKHYPVAYIIHGGPQAAWSDSWSTRWNPAVFAEQGFIVIAPNPTGSTGYGQAFTDAIRFNWGGDPYQDIVNAFDWVGKNLKAADNDRAVAVGASYGGYMMNWIQGHDLGRKFKAIVCHDGITSFAGGMFSTEELYFPFYDLGGTPWYDPKFDSSESIKTCPSDAHQAFQNFGRSTTSAWRQWDPSEHFANWSTPQLVIHSSKDYRLPISEGLAAFNVLQARGVESQFLTFEDENHWVLKPENSLLWHKVVLNWINKYVGLPAYTEEDPDSDEFYGGLRTEESEDNDGAQMPTIGQDAM